MRRPGAIISAGQHQRVVAAAILRRRAWRAVFVLLEHRPPVADLFADLLPLDIAIVVLGRNTQALWPTPTAPQAALQPPPPPLSGLLPDAMVRDIQALILQTEEVVATARACQAFIRSNAIEN